MILEVYILLLETLLCVVLLSACCWNVVTCTCANLFLLCCTCADLLLVRCTIASLFLVCCNGLNSRGLEVFSLINCIISRVSFLFNFAWLNRVFLQSFPSLLFYKMLKDDITSPAQPFLYISRICLQKPVVYSDYSHKKNYKKKKARFQILKTYETLVRAADPIRRDQRIQIYDCEFILEFATSISFVRFDLQQKVKSRFDLRF